jgi:hypothetical protein
MFMSSWMRQDRPVYFEVWFRRFFNRETNMKTFHRMARLLFSATVATSLMIATASAQDVLGTWSCGMTAEDPSGEGSISVELEVTFSRDGTYRRDGEMTIVMAALQVDTSIAVRETGSWTLDSMVLTTVPGEIELQSTDESPSQMEQMIVQQMQSAAQDTSEESITITSLTATTMTLDAEGEAMMCEKA